MLLPHLLPLPLPLLASLSTILECYRPRQPPLPPLHPITVGACIRTATLLDGDKDKAPMVFSRSPTAGFQVPHQFSGLSACTIDIDVRGEDDEVVMTLDEIAAVAVGIATICNRQPELGGKMWVPDKGAAKEKMSVTVKGVEWPVVGVGAGNGSLGRGRGGGMVGDAGRNRMVEGEVSGLGLGLVGDGTRVGTARRSEGWREGDGDGDGEGTENG